MGRIPSFPINPENGPEGVVSAEDDDVPDVVDVVLPAEDVLVFVEVALWDVLAGCVVVVVCVADDGVPDAKADGTNMTTIKKAIIKTNERLIYWVAISNYPFPFKCSLSCRNFCTFAVIKLNL